MIGCDIAQISRFKSLVDSESFLKKYFTKREIEYICSKQNKVQTLAGLYACKEAILKALKMGIGGQIRLTHLEILHDKNGAPMLNFTPELNYYLSSINCTKIDVSISHDGDYAYAVCQVL